MGTVASTLKSDGDTMIHFCTGASNKDLALKMAEHIKTAFTGVEQVFQPVNIITPNKAQHQWVKEHLAEGIGFIGNLKQHSFYSFYKDLIASLDPDFKEKPSGEKLIWKLFTEMGTPEFKQKFENIKNYCGEDEIKRLALAQKIAGLFDSYQEFDPEEEWKKQDHPDLEWQKYLYNQCGFSNNQMSPKKFKELIRQKPEKLESYHSLYIFGNVSLSPLYFQYLKVLKEVEGFSVHLFRTYLDLRRENNPLNQNWGELAVKTNEQLNQLGVKPEFNYPPEGGNLLNKIQKDICFDSISDNLMPDDSVLIYNSFTRVREVEALYNYLLKTVDESKGELGARDIMVCIPNLDPYISDIRTVFDSSPYKFPYTLVTEGYGREESFWTALEQVLAFEEENFTAPGVFNLLEMQPIQNAFGFTDLDLLKKAFIDANIRREYEGNKDLETNFSSFSNGLERLIYGFCLGSDEPVEINGKKIYPVDIAEGQQAQDLFRLHHLVKLLQNFLSLKEKPKTAGAWHIELMRITEEFLQPEDWQQNQFSELMQELGFMEDSSLEEINFNTFFFRLKDQLQNKDLQQIKGNGGIVFSGLYPGMSMPKKVIAFLGLNFGGFPRKSQELSFDLLPENKKLSSRIKDRGAFLETFLNAENRVLLSYIGQNVKDNSVIPSSAIISELQDYVMRAGAGVREIKHLLHSHSSEYFEEGDEEERDLYTYLINDRRKNSLKENPPVHFETPLEITLTELEGFLKDPFKHYYRKRLGVFYKQSEELPDWELFSLNALDNWKLKKNSLDHYQNDEKEDLDHRRLELVRKSQLPLKNIGLVKLEAADNDVGNLVETLDYNEIQEVEAALSLSIDGKQISLTGIVHMVGKQGLFLTVSKEGKKKYELIAYLQFLVLKAMGKADELQYICFPKKGNKAKSNIIAPEITKEEAKSKIAFYTAMLLKNYQNITSFYPAFNFSVKKVEDCGDPAEDKTVENLRMLIEEEVDSQNFYSSDYFQTEYHQGFFEGPAGATNLESFQKNYIEIFKPIESLFITKKGKK